MPALRTRDTQSRTLEVSTDAPTPPTLAIISPTPRAFTFPVNHNLSDSPYSSPSTSPFEPDLHPLSLCSTSPTSSYDSYRPQSPPLSALSTSPDHLGHRRRQSSCNSDIDPRPKKGDEGYVKRPENAFILFRRKCCEDRQAAQEEAAATGPTKKQRQADLSKTISQQWKALSDEERKYWDALAKEKKKEHEAMHPGYVYRPQRTKEGRMKARKGKGRKGEYDHDDSDCMSFVMPMAVPRHHGRSASAPTPPPTYQAVQVPNMYITPSCPSSPSLKPLIDHSSARPGEATMNFDYHPHDGLRPPSFAGYEASLQPSEYLHENSMFNMSGHGDAGALTMSPDEMRLPHHFSPASSISSASSGPSSPRSAHYTPLTNTLAHAYTQLDEHGCIDPHTQAEIDLQIQLQHDFDSYNPYGWDNTVWPAGNEMMVNEDFDINAIPTLDLGMSMKYHGVLEVEASSAMSEYSQDYSQDYPHDYPQDLYPQTLSGSVYPDDPYEDSMRYDELMPHSY